MESHSMFFQNNKRIKTNLFLYVVSKTGRPDGAKQTQTYQSLQTVLLLWSIF